MKRQSILIAVLIALTVISHVLFTKWETALREPYHFVFDLSEVDWPSTGITGSKQPAKPLTDTEILEVAVCGSFNSWGNAIVVDSSLGVSSTWILEKRKPGRWESFAKIPLPSGMSDHFYKFRVRNTRSDTAVIWIRDMKNPVKVDDMYGGFNSVIQIKSVADMNRIITSILLLSLSFAFLIPFLQWALTFVSKLPLPFSGKVSLLSVLGALFISAVALANTAWTTHDIYSIRDAELANLFFDLHRPELSALLRSDTSAPTDWRTIANNPDTVAQRMKLNDAFRSGILDIRLYSSNGKLVGYYPSAALVGYLYGHSDFADDNYQDMQTEGKSVVRYIEQPGYRTIRGARSDQPVWEPYFSYSAFIVRTLIDPKTEDYFEFYYHPITTSSERIAGHLVIHFSGGSSGRSVRADTIRLIFERSIIFLLLAVAVIIIASLLFSRMLLDPFRRLTEGFHRVRSEDYSKDVTIESRDEISDVADVFNQMVNGLKQRRNLELAFRRYVPDAVVRAAAMGPAVSGMAGEVRTCSIMFADIRGFTKASNRLPPADTVRLLNLYYAPAVEEIRASGGIVDKFIGDAIMAVWGAPDKVDDYADRAMRTAIRIQERVLAMNRDREPKGEIILYFGIGVSTGDVVAGHVGTEERADWTVIGAEVNLAQRISSISWPYCVLVSEKTSGALRNRGDLKFRQNTDVKLRGFEHPVRIQTALWFEGHSAPLLDDATAGEWYVSSKGIPEGGEGKARGPFTLNNLIRLPGFSAKTLISRSGKDDWKPWLLVARNLRVWSIQTSEGLKGSLSFDDIAHYPDITQETLVGLSGDPDMRPLREIINV